MGTTYRSLKLLETYRMGRANDYNIETRDEILVIIYGITLAVKVVTKMNNVVLIDVPHQGEIQLCQKQNKSSLY
jgi:hypothetical protein